MNRDQYNALVSVYDKTGIEAFVDSLLKLGWRIYSSGGTARYLMDHGLEVTDIATLVGEPILGHRVVTLSREVHAGLLARDTDEDCAELERLGIPWFGLVCVDMYPLEEAIAKPDATLESVIEATDIGGPTMLRSGVKGNRIVICHAEDRPTVIYWLSTESTNGQFIMDLAAKAEATVAEYCLASARYRSGGKM